MSYHQGFRFNFPIFIAISTATMLATASPFAANTVKSVYGTPTIDGQEGNNEWDSSASFSLQVEFPNDLGGGSNDATVFVQNDGSNIYLAFRLSGPQNRGAISYVFDQDNDGIAENGDDAVLVNWDSDFTDSVRTDQGFTPDTSLGGTRDGTAAASYGSNVTFFELSHPLNSNDTNDISLIAGDKTGVRLRIGICSNTACKDTIFPVQTFYELETVTSGSQPPVNQPAELFFAQFGDGKGVTSDIVLANPSPTQSVSGTIYFYDDDGNQVDIELAGSSVPSSIRADSDPLTFTIPPMGQKTFTTANQESLVTGSIRVTSSHSIGGVVRFSLPNAGIAGVGESLPLGGMLIPVRSTGTGINSGIAVTNCQDEPIILELLLRDSQGVMIENGYTIFEDFPGRGHIAKFINELFPDANINSFSGTLEVIGAPIAATALELGQNPGEFTTLPVIPIVFDEE